MPYLLTSSPENEMYKTQPLAGNGGLTILPAAMLHAGKQLALPVSNRFPSIPFASSVINWLKNESSEQTCCTQATLLCMALVGYRV